MTKDFMVNPTKKHLIIFTVLWLILNGLLVLSSIDLFTDIFQKKLLIIVFLMIWSTTKLIQLYRNYYENKKFL